MGGCREAVGCIVCSAPRQAQVVLVAYKARGQATAQQVSRDVSCLSVYLALMATHQQQLLISCTERLHVLVHGYTAVLVRTR